MANCVENDLKKNRKKSDKKFLGSDYNKQRIFLRKKIVTLITDVLGKGGPRLLLFLFDALIKYRFRLHELFRKHI